MNVHSISALRNCEIDSHNEHRLTLVGTTRDLGNVALRVEGLGKRYGELEPLQKIISRDKSVRLRIAPVRLENLFLHLTGRESHYDTKLANHPCALGSAGCTCKAASPLDLHSDDS